MKQMNRRILTGMLIIFLMIFANMTQAQQKPPKRSITQIEGDLYRFQNNFHFSVFLVTPEGIIVTDPINAGVAQWLKAELTKRFKKEVKYVIYSHEHPDHIAGGEVFADTAIVVAHENAKKMIIGEKRPTAVPDVTFTDRMVIELGGKTVELSYVGRNHSDNMIVMRFPEQEALYAVDFIPVKTVAFRTLGDSYLTEWIASLKVVEQMDFKMLLPGHGRVGNREDVRAYRGYMEDLYAAVLAQVRAGKTMDEAKGIQLEKYKDWGQYKNWFPLNVEGVYTQIQMHRRPNPKP